MSRFDAKFKIFEERKFDSTVKDNLEILLDVIARRRTKDVKRCILELDRKVILQMRQEAKSWKVPSDGRDQAIQVDICAYSQ